MNANRQQGAALIVGLVVLLVMTLIGISSMSTTTSQLKMSNNIQTHQMAFQATEAIASFFSDGKNKTDNPFNIDWSSSALQTFTNLDPAVDGKTTTDMDVAYIGCTNVPMEQGLTGDTQDGGSGSFRGLVHNLEIVSAALNSSGDPVGEQNDRVNGVQTIAPGCPNAAGP